MRVTGRRALLAGAGVLAGASLATALLLRKPASPAPAAAPAEQPPRLQDIAALRRLSPPVPAPPIVFLDADGRQHRLAEFAGRGVLLNLWATWCVPCVAEMPALDRLAAALAGAVTMLPLSIDRGGAAVVRAFYAAHGIRHLPIWCDPQGTAGEALGIAGVPTTFLIDAQGRETGVLQGPADWASAEALATVRALA